MPQQRPFGLFVAGWAAGFFACMTMLTAGRILDGPDWVAGLVLCASATVLFPLLAYFGWRR